MPTAVVLPGRSFGHGPEQAGLWLTRVALERAGLEPVLVDWPEDGMPRDVEGATAAVAQIVAPYLDQDPAYVVAKSLGTLAAPLATERGLPAIWLTPLLDEPVCRDAILASSARQLLIGGGADFSWDRTVAADAARGGAAVVELPDADHGFMVEANPIATAQVLVGLVATVMAFLDG